MRSREAGIWYLQRIDVGLWLEILGVLWFERSWRRKSILLGRRCWVGALWVVSLPEPCYQSIKLLGSFLYARVFCMICISIFDILLILNHLWICIFAFLLGPSLVASSCSLVTGSCSLVISWESSSCSLEQARRQVAVDTQRGEDLDRGTTGR